MKKVTRSSTKLALLAILFLGATFLLTNSAFAEVVANLQEIQGEVMIRPVNSAPDAWQAASANTPLNNGDSVKTMNGSCTIVCTDQATIKVEPNTTVMIQDKADTKDILLSLGKLRMNVNKEKATKPFQVVTPTAVGAVRGTDVDFDFNENGELTVDLHDGNVLVYNDEAGMQLDLASGHKVKINYNTQSGILKIQNDCGSKGVVTFNVLGTEYAESPCEEKEIDLGTAEGQAGTPDTPPGDPSENPRDDIPQGPVSPID